MAAFTSGQGDSSQAVLDLINAEARDILSRDWPFLKRWGVLTTLAASTGTDATVTNGSVAVGLSSVTDVTEVTGEHVARIAITDDASYPGTSFRIVSGIVSGAFGGQLETEYPGTTNAGSGDYTLFAAEYLLPETVDGVYQVVFEEHPLDLVFTDETELRSGYPRLWDDTGEPRLVAVGGTETATYDSSGSAPDPKLRMLVFPVPDEAYVLRYQYKRAFADMTATTDTLSGVPEKVIDKIVDMAYAKASLSNIFNDPALGAANLNEARGATDRIRKDSKPDRGRRFTVRSLDNVSGSDTNFGRLPDDTFGQP